MRSLSLSLLSLSLLPCALASSSSTSSPALLAGSPSSSDGWTFLPSVRGASLDVSTFSSRASRKGDTDAVLPVYITAGVDGDANARGKVKRVVLMQHGDDRDAWDSWTYTDMALDTAIMGGDVKREEVVIVSPQVFTTLDYLAYNASTSVSAPSSGVMVWDPQTDWSGGSSSLFPSSSSSSSSSPTSNIGIYTLYDALLSHFLDRTAYPNLVTLVVAGFSRGAQLVHRYATLRPAGDEDRVKYWIAAPASFVYLNDSRPEHVRKSCDGFNEWRYGLEGVLPAYANETGVELTQAGLAPRFVARRMAYLVGARDKVDGDAGCEADAQGKDHITKMRNYITSVLPYLSPSTSPSGSLPANTTIDYVRSAQHQDWRIINSDAGVQRLFLDDYAAFGQNARAGSGEEGDGSTSDPTKDAGADDSSS